MLVHHSKKLNQYIEQLNLASLFSFPVTPLCELHYFKKYEYIFTQSDHPNYLFFFVSGRAKVHQLNKNGTLTIVKFYTTGEMIGELELIDVYFTTTSVQAMEDVYCIGINTLLYKDRLLHDPVFLLYLAKQIGTKMLEDTENFARNQVYPLENRLAAFLLEYEEEGVFNEKLTEAADYLGCSYRHLLRVLAAFSQDGHIKKEADGYHLTDLHQLHELASACK